MRKDILIAVGIIVVAVAVVLVWRPRPAVTPAPANNQPVANEPELPPVAAGYTRVTYFTSPKSGDSLKYCNGGDMDSVGFGKILTAAKTKDMKGKLSLIDQARTAISLASADSGVSPNLAEQKGYITIKNQIAYIKNQGGWAGVSIFLCAWKPLVEKNLMQFGEIKQVVWL